MTRNVTSTLRVALVGCGKIADAHLQELRKTTEAHIVALCDSIPDLAAQAATRFSVPAHFTTLGDLLRSTAVDVVHITTPPHTHAPLALQAMEAGCHVYVEKPFTSTVAEADTILNAAVQVGRLVCVGHDHLFDPIWLECRRRIAAGELGDVIHIDSVQGYDLQGEFGRAFLFEPGHWIHGLPGGLFQNTLSHAIYKLTEFITDDEPQIDAVWFHGHPSVPYPTELRATLVGAHVSGSLLFSSLARPLQRVVRIYGTRGTMEIDFDAQLIRTYPSATLPGAFSKIEIPYRLMVQSTRRTLRNVWRFTRSDIHFFAGMNGLFQAFYQAILAGTAPPIASTEIRRVTDIMDRIFKRCAIHDLQSEVPRPDESDKDSCSLHSISVMK